MEKKTTLPTGQAGKTDKPKAEAKEKVKITPSTTLPTGRQEAPEVKKEEATKVEAVVEDPKKTIKKVTIKKVTLAKGKYIRTIGRRKSSIATIHLFNERGDITINDKAIDNYFDYKIYGGLIIEPLKLVGANGKFKITIRVKGGGKRGQVDAIRLGISRALIELDPDLRKTLKSNGLLKRDPRVKERKKPGLKRARKAPQWSKR